MKRKTTITLTIAGLLGLAGMLYAANHDFFKGVQGGPKGAPPAPDANPSFFSGDQDPNFHAYVYTYSHIHANLYSYIHTYIHSYVYAYSHGNIHAPGI